MYETLEVLEDLEISFKPKCVFFLSSRGKNDHLECNLHVDFASFFVCYRCTIILGAMSAMCLGNKRPEKNLNDSFRATHYKAAIIRNSNFVGFFPNYHSHTKLQPFLDFRLAPEVPLIQRVHMDPK